LNWAPQPDARLWHVYRSGPDGFTQITAQPTHWQGFADLQVANGQPRTYHVRALNASGLGEPSRPITLTPQPFRDDHAFLDYLQATAFDFFWREANPANGLIRDRTQTNSPSSIAAVGFGLTALGIGADHGWITRAQASERALATLRFFHRAPQSTNAAAGWKGWFYHFLDMNAGERFWKCELSSIDTALLLGGVLYAREYFDQPAEAEIRVLADEIFARVDWRWMLNGGETLTMGWHPETGFIKSRWEGYNEASILYLLGLGAKNQPLEPAHWAAWTKTYRLEKSWGQEFIHFPPLFGHQYSACWIDFRGIADAFTAAKGLTYFENSRRATLAQRAYCIANPGQFTGYGPDSWGLTACDGPFGYAARGAPPAENDDGTIAPTAAGGSIPFAPAECLKCLRNLYNQHREKIWTAYGFRDAFNLQRNWWGPDVLGIDQGPILIMAENHRTGRVWEVMRKNFSVREGLRKAGFRKFPN